MTTLVTGATGAVGIPLVRALLDRGDDLRILVRPESTVDALPDVEFDESANAVTLHASGALTSSSHAAVVEYRVLRNGEGTQEYRTQFVR